MKSILLSLVFLIAFSQFSFSQDSYKKRYYVKQKVTYDSLTENISKENKKEILKKCITDAKGDSAKIAECKENSVYLMINTKAATKTVYRNGQNVEVNYFEGEEFKFCSVGKNQTPGILERIFRPSIGRIKANVKFVNDSIYVNPWLFAVDDYRENIFYYKLKNRQSLKLHYRQWSLNALAVPLKLRFGDETEISTGANLGALIGHTWGYTNFVHRTKIDNKTYDQKLTFGMFLGTEKLEFSYEIPNEVDGEDPTKEEVKTGFLSIGTGLLYSYEKFTMGAVFGYDIGLGKNVDEWDYNKKPWLGFTLGYSLFSF
ncbi:hypothetical protein [Formosa algae]|uniref:hypothetical protein n=1 Tax=Formosa algae TaxID=225843 RepID=UPI000CCEF999|nr:hypothetical protein [Formosa algae]PNW28929.1 hypothetical protein BKP44_06725 [Formosa algae]